MPLIDETLSSYRYIKMGVDDPFIKDRLIISVYDCFLVASTATAIMAMAATATAAYVTVAGSPTSSVTS